MARERVAGGAGPGDAAPQGFSRYLQVFVFVTGASVMGIEMAASRLLAPFFGTSLLVWANLIGLIMVGLAVGYWLGGRLADRRPRLATLCQLALAAGLLTAAVPLWTRPVFARLQVNILEASAGLILGSFVAAAVSFVPPVILLGCVSPFALRLAAPVTETAGRVAGRLYAVSTFGSLAGIYLASFVGIPWLGTRETLLSFALALILISLPGLWRPGRGPGAAALALLVPPLVYGLTHGVIRAQPGLLYERDTPYQFIQVARQGSTTYLSINEGGGIQSLYDPERPLFDWYSDHVAVLPYLLEAEQPRGLLVGLAGGTVPRQMAALRARLGGPVLSWDAVEIDPALVGAARRYFGLRPEEARVFVDDGRTYLTRTRERYDLIFLDAYAREVYIPFHLVTVEFFELVKQRLRPGGFMVVNLNVTRPEAPLLTSVLATVRRAFPHTYWAKVRGAFNYFIIGSLAPLDWSRLQAPEIPALLRPLAAQLAAQVQTYTPNPAHLVLTDNRAPTEFLTDLMIVEYGFGQLGAGSSGRR